MSVGAGAAAAGSIVVLDYVQNLGNSAVCRFLRDERERGEGTDFVINVGYAQLCEPYEEEPPPPVPPNTVAGGGDPCRLYRVTYQVTDSNGAISLTDQVLRGPVRMTEIVDTFGGDTRRRFFLQGGTGVDCPLQQFQAAATSDILVLDVNAAIVAVVPLQGDPITDTPITTPPVLEPQPPSEGDDYNISVEVNGENIETTVNFEPIITNNFGDFLPFTVAPSANFNLDVDISSGNPPRFGIDLDLEVVLPLNPDSGSPSPVGGGEPIDIPVSRDPEQGTSEGFDYERIEYAIELAKCCKTTTSTQTVGTYEFEEYGTVRNIDLPPGTIGVYLEITPSATTRIYKLSNSGSEFAHGNASITTEGRVIGFERIYVGKHFLAVPYELEGKGLRLSLQKDTICAVTALIHTPPPPPTDG